MKKITAILLLTIYSLTTMGVGIRQFYCCGKLKSTSITLVQEAKEKCNNSDGMKGCCKTKFKSLKVKASHVTTDNAVNFTKSFTDLHLLIPVFEMPVLANQTLVAANASHAPPPGQDIPVYILHCAYLI
jgi:hypothetical protein